MKFELIINKDREEKITAEVRKRNEIIDRIEELVDQYNDTDSIAGFREDEMKTLSFSDIECILVEDGKTYAVDRKNDRYRIRYKLYEIEKILPGYFIRINKSSVANRRRIERFSMNIAGAVDANFRSGFKEYVSRRCFAEIKKEMGL